MTSLYSARRVLALAVRWLAKATSRRMDGQSMVEYALMLVLIGVMGITVLVIMGNQVHNVFSNVSCMLSTMGGSCAPAAPPAAPMGPIPPPTS